MANAKQPTLVVSIANYAYERIRAFVDKAKGEIGGMLAVERHGDELHIARADLLPQQVSAGGVELDDVAVMEWLKNEKLYTGEPIPYVTFGFWHSHAGFSVFWSKTDEDTLVKAWLTRGFLVNLVMNKKGEIRVRVDTLYGGATLKDSYQATQDNLELEVDAPFYPELIKTVNAEYDERVKEAVVVVAQQKGRGNVAQYVQTPMLSRDETTRLARVVLTKMGWRVADKRLESPDIFPCGAAWLFEGSHYTYWGAAHQVQKALPPSAVSFQLVDAIVALVHEDDRRTNDLKHVVKALPSILGHLTAPKQKSLVLTAPAIKSAVIASGVVLPNTENVVDRLDVLQNESVEKSWRGCSMTRSGNTIRVLQPNGRVLFSALASPSFRLSILNATGLDIAELRDMNVPNTKTIYTKRTKDGQYIRVSKEEFDKLPVSEREMMVEHGPTQSVFGGGISDAESRVVVL